MSDSLQPHGLQHTRLPCPSLSLWACSNSCPLGWWCYLTSHPLLPLSPSALNLSQHQGLYNELALHIRWPKYWSVHFSISLSNELALHISWPKYWSFSFSIGSSSEFSGLISLGLTGLISLLSKGPSSVFSSTTVQKHQFSGTQLSFLYGSAFTSVHDYWKNNNLDYVNFYRQSDVSAF